MDKVRYGIIGIGNMGNGYLNDYVNEKIVGGVLTAVCDTSGERLEAARQKLPEGCLEFDDPIELIESGTVDAVVIATPHYDHPTLAIKAFENGLHVVIEKPAGVYSKNVKKMNELAKASGKKFMIMFQTRTNPNYVTMRKMVEDGALGDIKRVTILITEWYRPQAYYDSGSWRATWDGEGGGVLLNQAPHNLDHWQWIVGMMPSKVRAFCHNGKWHDIEVEDDVSAYFEYENGATGVFVTSTGDYPGTNYFEIAGDLGRLVYTGGKLSFFKNRMSEREFNRTSTVQFSAPGGAHEEVELVKAPIGGGHIGMMNNFFASILNGEEIYVPGEEGLKSLILSNAIHLSAWLDKTIEIPFDDDLFLEELNKRRSESKVKESTSAKIADLNDTFLK